MNPGVFWALGALLLVGALGSAALGGCAAPESPRLLSVAPADLASPGAPCARAAFELPLQADGSVRRDDIRLILWEGTDSEHEVLFRLRERAAASRWRLPAKAEPGAAAFALLRLHCHGAVDSGGTNFGRRVEAARRARRQAAAELARRSGSRWSEHDLDCLWSRDLESLKRGPFLHDMLELPPADAAAVQAASGLWVCRAARTSHQGQFVFLDHELRFLGVGRYWIGE